LPLLLLQSELLAELEGELFDLRDQLAASAGEARQQQRRPQQQQQQQEAPSWGARLRSRVQAMRLPWQAPVEAQDNSSRGAYAFKLSAHVDAMLRQQPSFTFSNLSHTRAACVRWAVKQGARRSALPIASLVETCLCTTSHVVADLSCTVMFQFLRTPYVLQALRPRQRRLRAACQPARTSCCG
jgi:hypothetical protein